MQLRFRLFTFSYRLLTSLTNVDEWWPVLQGFCPSRTLSLWDICILSSSLLGSGTSPPHPVLQITATCPFLWGWGPGGPAAGTHRHHVITLHIRLVVVLTFVVELAEEVESHHRVEINHNSQETDSQNQLGVRGETRERGWVFTFRFEGDAKERGKWRGLQWRLSYCRWEEKEYR